MALTIVNITLLKVRQEIEDFLESYPEQIYKLVVADKDLYQELVAYVLNRTTNRFLVIPEENVSSIQPESLILTTEERFNLEKLIFQGIYLLGSRQLTLTHLSSCS
ncbi:MAG TPA: hypothetical protein DDZ80_26975 [Cyanobacteria bacterium UBA8803]|nr:hypothetical protein [Cyanobacteria bacterium UBA9273]HBL61920.1 hypothetical protein [Cyanobacteria bacterium UBA8803]